MTKFIYLLFSEIKIIIFMWAWQSTPWGFMCWPITETKLFYVSHGDP